MGATPESLLGPSWAPARERERERNKLRTQVSKSEVSSLSRVWLEYEVARLEECGRCGGSPVG